LVFLRDLNQQMMPTGFRWDDLIRLLHAPCQRYGYGLERFDPNLGFAEAEREPKAPFCKLMNNYRTTEEIAKFAYEMLKNIAEHSLSGKALTSCLENIIHPGRTLLIQLEDEYLLTPPEDRVPRIVVVEQDAFVKGLRQYLQRLRREEREHRLVVIATDDAKITAMVREDATLLPYLA